MASTRMISSSLAGAGRLQSSSSPTSETSAPQITSTSSTLAVENGKAEVSSSTTPQSDLVTRGFSANFVIPFEELKLENHVGAGGFGDVYKGSWQGMTVAIKQLKISHCSEKGRVDEFLNECKMMEKVQRLNLPGVIGYAGCSLDSAVQSYRLVMEYAPGTVFDWIKSYQVKSEHAPWATCYKILEETATVFEHLHANKIVYGDPKWENILLKGERVKFGDWGRAFCLLPGEKFKANIGDIGTLSYLAPEALNQNIYGMPANVYAFGVMMFVMAVQGVPYSSPGTTDERKKRWISKGILQPIPETCPPEIARLIKKCWLFAPDKRPTFSELRNELHDLRLKLSK